MIPVARLNHAVLFVRDLDRSAGFYERVFGFEEIAREAAGWRSCAQPDRRTTTTWG